MTFSCDANDSTNVENDDLAFKLEVPPTSFDNRGNCDPLGFGIHLVPFCPLIIVRLQPSQEVGGSPSQLDCDEEQTWMQRFK